MSEIPKYNSIKAVGHKSVGARLFKGPVLIQEKLDGSQLSIRMINGKFEARSRGKMLDMDNPDKNFALAVSQLKDLPLTKGWTYRGECLARPKHNILAYERTPKLNFILFDIDLGMGVFARIEQVKEEAARLGLEVAPSFFYGEVSDLESLNSYLEMSSCLGGTKVEGIVIKNYAERDQHGSVLMGKLVGDSFWEKQKVKPAKKFQTLDTKISVIAEQYATEARWRKAVQHLKDDGKLRGEPCDIGPLVQELKDDLWQEYGDELTEQVLKLVKPIIYERIILGFPQWYKKQLAASAFDDKTENTPDQGA